MPSSIKKIGGRGKQVTLLQEWLCLHGLGLKIDGHFGSVTESAVVEFQRRFRLKRDGIVGLRTWKKLVKPMETAVKGRKLRLKGLRSRIKAVSYRQLKQHPREIGGQNRGPWVRLYTKGLEGRRYPWCAGFVSYVVRQAAEGLNRSCPLKYTLSCDNLALQARRAGMLLEQPNEADRAGIRPGSIFLVRKRKDDWIHAGIVERTQKNAFFAIEGNTSDEGSPEG